MGNPREGVRIIVEGLRVVSYFGSGSSSSMAGGVVGEGER